MKPASSSSVQTATTLFYEVPISHIDAVIANRRTTWPSRWTQLKRQSLGVQIPAHRTTRHLEATFEPREKQNKRMIARGQFHSCANWRDRQGASDLPDVCWSNDGTEKTKQKEFLQEHRVCVALATFGACFSGVQGILRNCELSTIFAFPIWRSVLSLPFWGAFPLMHRGMFEGPFSKYRKLSASNGGSLCNLEMARFLRLRKFYWMMLWRPATLLIKQHRFVESGTIGCKFPLEGYLLWWFAGMLMCWSTWYRASSCVISCRTLNT